MLLVAAFKAEEDLQRTWREEMEEQGESGVAGIQENCGGMPVPFRESRPSAGRRMSQALAHIEYIVPECLPFL
jgi:hypothetical protein